MSDLQKNTSYCQDTIKLRDSIEEGFVVLGERLQKIYEKRLFEPKWETWQDYLEELRMDKSTASKLIKIYQVFVMQYGVSKKRLATVGRESAYELAGIVTSKKDANEWLEKGENLRRDDLRIAIRELKTGVMQVDCAHDFVQLRFCTKCGLKEKIHND